MHATHNLTDTGVLLSDKPSHVMWQHRSHFGILSLSDRNIDSLRLDTKAWKSNPCKFLLSSMLAIESSVDMVTFLVRAGALTYADGKTTPVSIAIHNGTQGKRDDLRHLATLHPDLFQCTEVTYSKHKEQSNITKHKQTTGDRYT